MNLMVGGEKGAPLAYLCDYSDLNAEYERRGQRGPHNGIYFGMNIRFGERILSWIGHLYPGRHFTGWLHPGFWRDRDSWDAQLLWPFGAVEVSWYRHARLS